MGLERSEQIPICPVGVEHGSEEFANWYDSLLPENQAILWVSWTKEKIDIFQSLPDIDQARAIRGIVVGDICGDATNGFYGAQFFIQTGSDFEKRKTAAIGIERAWLKATMAIDSFKQHLPEKCQKEFMKLFRDHEQFVKDFIANPNEIDQGNLLNKLEDLQVDFRGIYHYPPGMKYSDIDYAIEVSKKHRFSTDPGER